MTPNQPISGSLGSSGYNPQIQQNRIDNKANHTSESVFNIKDCKFGEDDKSVKLIHDQYWGTSHNGEKTGINKALSDIQDKMNEFGDYIKTYKDSNYEKSLTSTHQQYWGADQENANTRFNALSDITTESIEILNKGMITIAEAGQIVGNELASFFNTNDNIVEASPKESPDISNE